MDGSRVVSRCLQHLHRWPRSSLHNSSSPCSHRRIALCSASKHSHHTSRTFSTSLQRYQDEPSNPSPSPAQSITQDTPQPQRAAPTSRPEPRIDATTTTSPSSSSRAPTPRTQPPQRTKSDLGASTLAAIDALINQNRARAAAAANPSQKPSRPVYNQDLYGRGGSVAQRSAQSANSPFASPSGGYPNMRGLLSDLDGSGSNASIFGTMLDEKPAEMFLRLKPSLGKSTDLDDSRGVGLTRAFQLLEMKMNKNGVKRDLKAQKFHVRRGQARKLHRRERWRTLFKEGFLGECAKVRRMIKQGW